MPTITAYISSKDRYFTTLPMAISSVITQTVKPEKLIIFLDGEHVDLRENSVYKNLFSLMDTKGIAWELIFSLKKGQVFNHHWVSQNAKTEWIWRVDDDNIAEPDVLEKLLRNTHHEQVGAIAGLVIDPKTVNMVPANASNNIKDINTAPNIQWFKHPSKALYDVEHLYSSFLYRKAAGVHGYCLQLSPVGHREETIFSYEMKRKGWTLLVDTSATTWHVREPVGGIRAYNNPEFYEQDEKVFSEKMKHWGMEDSGIKLIVLDNGLGDHWAFKSVLSEIQEKHKDKKIIIAVCYPEVFADVPGITMISISNATQLVSDIDRYNIYRFCWERNWNRSIIDAYRELYL